MRARARSSWPASLRPRQAEIGLAAALIPGADLKLRRQPCEPCRRLRGRSSSSSAQARAALARYPAIVPVALLAVAPFRISVSIGAQKAYLLAPLYVVARGRDARARLVAHSEATWEEPLPPLLAVPAAAFVALAGISLLWTRDLRQGSDRAPLLSLPVLRPRRRRRRSPWRTWHPRALAATLIALAGLFSAVALFQRVTHGHLLAGDVERANAYTTYFRVTSLFKDPSIFGRHVVIAIAVLLVAIWLGRIGFWAGAALIAFLWAGLLLLVLAVELRRALRGRRCDLVRPRRTETAARAARGRGGLRARRSGVRRRERGQRLRAPGDERPHAARTSDVGRLREPSARRRRNRRPATGEQGRGQHAALRQARPLAHDAAHRRGRARLARPPRLCRTACRRERGSSSSSRGRDRALGLAAGAVFLALFIHSLFYAGFFEDPIVWGVMALAALGLRRSASHATERRSRRAAEVTGRTRTARPSDRFPSCSIRLRWQTSSARVRRRILLIVLLVVLLIVGAGAAYLLKSREHPGGKLDTKLSGVFASVATNVDGDDAAEEEGPLPPRRRQALLGQLRRRSCAHALATRDRHRPAAAALLGRRPPQLHRVPAQLLRRHPLRQHVRRKDGRARLPQRAQDLGAARRRRSPRRPRSPGRV